MVKGRIIHITSGRGISKVVLKDEEGVRREFKPEETFEFAVVSNDMVKFQYFNESSTSIKAMLKTDRSAMKVNDFVVYRNAKLKRGKELLLQLLNPHFDERLQVFHAVNARKTTPLRAGAITLTGEMQRAYLVSKDGDQIMKVKKGNYKKSFERLFADSPDLSQVKKPKFKDFARHIGYYTKD